jgi:glycosyltransferase involved in cell wall biosynthesis
MARGLPVLAFDISYFRDLSQASQAVVLARWPEPAALAERLEELAADPERLAAMARCGVVFARSNTQAVWLERRAAWMRDVMRPPEPPLAMEGH